MLPAGLSGFGIGLHSGRVGGGDYYRLIDDDYLCPAAADLGDEASAGLGDYADLSGCINAGVGRVVGIGGVVVGVQHVVGSAGDAGGVV